MITTLPHLEIQSRSTLLTSVSEASGKSLWLRPAKLTLQAVWNCEGLWVSSTLRSKMFLVKAFNYLLTYGT